MSCSSSPGDGACEAVNVSVTVALPAGDVVLALIERRIAPPPPGGAEPVDGGDEPADGGGATGADQLTVTSFALSSVAVELSTFARYVADPPVERLTSVEQRVPAEHS